MKIEVLYFDGCPSWENGLKNLEAAMQGEGLSASVEMINVKDDNDSARLKSLGSPHIRVEGHDLWSEERENYSLSCGIYSTPGGIRGFPTIAMLREQLKQYKRA